MRDENPEAKHYAAMAGRLQVEVSRANSIMNKVAEEMRSWKFPGPDDYVFQSLERWADELNPRESHHDESAEPFRCANCHEPNAPALCHFCRDEQDDIGSLRAELAQAKDESAKLRAELAKEQKQ